MTVFLKSAASAAALALLLLLPAPAQAQRSGQSVQIQYGTVVSSQYVEEASKAPAGALVGGAIGLYSGKGKSSGTKFRRSAPSPVAPRPRRSRATVALASTKCRRRPAR